MIIAPSGQLVWFLPTKGTLKAFNSTSSHTARSLF